jgi:antitoxin component of RelBE/YafQ-DinJ toxin-antitoxin module
MGKTLSLKLNDEGEKKIDRFLEREGITPSELLRKALWQYINEVNPEVNLPQRKKNHKKVNQLDQKVNLKQQKKTGQEVNHEVNQVNHPVQIVENYELMRHYKEEIDWLRNRVEYFEGFCKDLQQDMSSKIDIKAKKESTISRFRM